MERDEKQRGADRFDQSEGLKYMDNNAIIKELDSIRIELGKVGIHFALTQAIIPRGHRASYQKDLRAYGNALDKLQALLPRLKRLGK